MMHHAQPTRMTAHLNKQTTAIPLSFVPSVDMVFRQPDHLSVRRRFGNISRICICGICSISGRTVLTCKGFGTDLPFRNCRNCRNCRHFRNNMSGMDDISDNSTYLAVSVTDDTDDTDDISDNSHDSRILILIISHLSPHFSINYKLSTINFLGLPISQRLGGIAV